MTLQVGEVKTFTLITGMEIIGRITSVEEGYFCVEEAFGVAVIDAGGGQMQLEIRPLTAFAPAQSKTAGMEIELYHSTILLSTAPPQGFMDHYLNHIEPHTIARPPEKKIITPK
jgi:hypothetical protein